MYQHLKRLQNRNYLRTKFSMTSTRWHKYNRVENIVDDAKAYQPIENTKKRRVECYNRKGTQVETAGATTGPA